MQPGSPLPKPCNCLHFCCLECSNCVTVVTKSVGESRPPQNKKRVTVYTFAALRACTFVKKFANRLVQPGSPPVPKPCNCLHFCCLECSNCVTIVTQSLDLNRFRHETVQLITRLLPKVLEPCNCPRKIFPSPPPSRKTRAPTAPVSRRVPEASGTEHEIIVAWDQGPRAGGAGARAKRSLCL